MLLEELSDAVTKKLDADFLGGLPKSYTSSIAPPPILKTSYSLPFPYSKIDPDEYFAQPEVDKFHWTVDKWWTDKQRALVRDAHQTLHKLLVDNMHKLVPGSDHVTLNISLHIKP